VRACSYISEHGGSCNAFTEAEWTCFHLALRQSALDGGMERLAAVMDRPLLREDTVAREVMAIESEFQQARLSDGPRSEQLLAAAMEPGHPAAAFLWGNRKSLVDDAAARGVSPRDQVEAFARARYLPGRMQLVVRAAAPLDELQAAAVRRFASVGAARAAEAAPAEEAAAPAGTDAWASPLPPPASGLPAVVRWRPVAARLSLSLAWVLPPVRGWWRADPCEYVSHCLGHEGAGSLLSHLRREGLAAALSAGVSEGGLDENTRFCTFRTTVWLTSEGAARWADVGAAVFAYLAMLRGEGPSEPVWDELCRSERLQYDFGDEEDGEEQVQALATGLVGAALTAHPGAEAAWRGIAGDAGAGAAAAAALASDGPVPDGELLTFGSFPTAGFEVVAPRVSALLAAMTPSAVRVSLAAPCFAPASGAGADKGAAPGAAAGAAAAGAGAVGDAEGGDDGQAGSDADGDDDGDDGEEGGEEDGASTSAGSERTAPSRRRDSSRGAEDDDDEQDDGDEQEDDEEDDDGDDDDEAAGVVALPPRALAALAPLELTSVEPWFATPYRVDDLDAAAFASWRDPAPLPSLRLPSPNPFLPSSRLLVHPAAGVEAAGAIAPSSALVADAEAAGDTVLGMRQGLAGAAALGSRLPSLLSSTPAGRLWWLQDPSCQRPVTAMTALLQLRPLAPRGACSDPAVAAAAELWCAMASDAAQEVVYTAHMAGLSLGARFSWRARALLIEAEGFSPKLPVLLAAFLRALVQSADPAAPGARARFDRLREVASRRASSMHLKPATQADSERLRLSLGEAASHRDTRVRGLAAVTLGDVAALARASLEGGDGVFFEACVAGNETPATARRVFAAALTALGTAGGDADAAAASVDPASLRCAALLSHPLAPRHAVALLPRGATLTRRLVPHRAGTRSAAACLYFQCPSPRTPALAARLRLLEALMEEPLFDQLRTKEQLGYTVFCQGKCIFGVGGMAVVVQGSRHPAEHLRDRAAAFLSSWVSEDLPRTDAARFETQRDALVDSLREPPKTTQELMAEMWDAVESGCYDFGAAAAAAAEASSLTLADVVETASSLLVGDGQRLLVVLSDARHAADDGEDCTAGCGWADAAAAVAGRAVWDE